MTTSDPGQAPKRENLPLSGMRSFQTSIILLLVSLQYVGDVLTQILLRTGTLPLQPITSTSEITLQKCLQIQLDAQITRDVLRAHVCRSALDANPKAIADLAVRLQEHLTKAGTEGLEPVNRHAGAEIRQN